MPLSDYTVLYGGSFNPPHFGHAAACLWLTESLNAKQVIVAPTYEHKFNKKLAPFMDRVNMCESLEIGEGQWRSVEVSMIEERLLKPNLTINLVKHYIELTDKVAVVIGSDLLGEIDKWEGWDEVVRMAKIVVLNRPQSVYQKFNPTNCKYPVVSFPIEMPSMSSTEIRNRIKRNEPITGLVFSDVENYILENNLYKE